MATRRLIFNSTRRTDTMGEICVAPSRGFMISNALLSPGSAALHPGLPSTVPEGTNSKRMRLRSRPVVTG